MTHTSLWLSSGWKMVKDDLPTFAGLTFLAAALAAMAHALNAVLFLIFSGPALAAIYAVLLAHLRTGRIELKHVNDVGPVFLSAMLTGILVALFAALGLWFFIVPALIVLALYLFPLFLILERNLPFWDAMEESRRKVQDDLLGFVGFVAALLGINLLGAMCFGFGLLISIPVTLCAVAIAYRELWPEHVGPGPRQEQARHPLPSRQPPIWPLRHGLYGRSSAPFVGASGRPCERERGAPYGAPRQVLLRIPGPYAACRWAACRWAAGRCAACRAGGPECTTREWRAASLVVARLHR